MRHTNSVATLLRLVTGTLVLVLLAVFAVSAMDAWTRESDAYRVHSAAQRSPRKSWWRARRCGSRPA
jgi:hypothetical protein